MITPPTAKNHQNDTKQARHKGWRCLFFGASANHLRLPVNDLDTGLYKVNQQWVITSSLINTGLFRLGFTLLWPSVHRSHIPKIKFLTRGVFHYRVSSAKNRELTNLMLRIVACVQHFVVSFVLITQLSRNYESFMIFF
ncbi:hypothetical protein [Pusillimonas sp. ANT_WB101]|uniref:hypothetical protein n=1 Tax=Pusillimonas sp. ANT_WB101 TaxID=2597356 RepID=UPI0011F02987|nr:hypothetical protein [Pusillimonas sp. ANT_WB101]KAA0911537.1 hypothetical protein FQ179_06895 [Pusillimonas sp. ANT_WB101]